MEHSGPRCRKILTCYWYVEPTNSIAVDMAMLSKLWYFRLLDDRGRQYALSDIAIALLKSDYPVVTHFLYRNSEGEQMMLPWHTVKGIDWHHARINVSSFDSAQDR